MSTTTERLGERELASAEIAALRQVIQRVADHEWIIATAYDDATRNFGYQVNVRDGEPTAKGTQRYRPLPETFALTPADAGLAGLRSSGQPTTTEET